MRYVGRTDDSEVVPVGLVGAGRVKAQRDENLVRIALVMLLLTSGCTILADKRTVAGCQLADGYTTKRALDAGATEANPMLKDMSGNTIMGIKALFAALLYYVMPETKDMDKGEKFLYSALSVIGCGAAVNNVNVYQEMKDRP